MSTGSPPPLLLPPPKKQVDLLREGELQPSTNNNQEMLVSLGPNPSDPSFPLCVEFMWMVEVSGRSGSRLLSLVAESESRDYFGAKVQINLLRGCDLADLNQMRSAL